MTPLPASGAPYVLQSGGYRAEIAGIGASVRSLRHHDRDLVHAFDVDEIRPAMRGALLAPWPNRTADGRYTYGAQTHQLALTEPATRNAAHGLVCWLDFRPTRVEADRLGLTATIEPQPGYPWRVRVDVDFELSTGGLVQGVIATNESTSVAPFGMGVHPYLLAAPSARGVIDSWALDVPANAVLLASEDRMLPTRLVDVGRHERGAFDFREPRPIGATAINNAFTQLRRDECGITRVRVFGPDGAGAEIAWDERCPWVQIYTADVSIGGDDRHAVAVEPMTCPPDALNSGWDLLHIEPGSAVSAAWTIRSAERETPCP